MTRRATAPRPSLVFILRSFGFPLGMAATNRLRLLARAVREQDVDVRVICSRVSEQPNHVLNHRVRGVADGIPFVYAAGATVRSDFFAVRRYREIRGFVWTVLELRRLKAAGELDCIYLPEVAKRCSVPSDAGARASLRTLAEEVPVLWTLRLAALAMGIPIVVELNELPAVITWLPPALSACVSQLSGASAVVPISDWLRNYAEREARRLTKPFDILEVPIVVDLDEQPPTPYPRDAANFVFASSGYWNLVDFLFRAMRSVWQHHPHCRLTITGGRPDIATRLAREAGIEDAVADGRLTFTGYLNRSDLIDLYRSASALLVPLHDDLESRARFPTKIGEYLAAARPVVTTAIGEIPRFLTDDETAYVVGEEDPEAYAARLVDVLDDPDKAERIGLAGREVAKRSFDYRLQGPRLARLIETLSRGGETMEGTR